MKLLVTYSNEILIDKKMKTGWVVLMHEGEWDTYREWYFFSQVKPTKRELRKAVKSFMHPRPKVVVEAIFEDCYDVEVRYSPEDWGLIATNALGFTDLMALVDQYNYGLPNEAYLVISLNGVVIPTNEFFAHLPQPE